MHQASSLVCSSGRSRRHQRSRRLDASPALRTQRCLRTRLASNTAFTAQEAHSMCNTTGSLLWSLDLSWYAPTTEEPGTEPPTHPSPVWESGKPPRVFVLTPGPWCRCPQAATDRSFRRDPDVQAILRWPEGGVDGESLSSLRGSMVTNMTPQTATNSHIRSYTIQKYQPPAVMLAPFLCAMDRFGSEINQISHPAHGLEIEHGRAWFQTKSKPY